MTDGHRWDGTLRDGRHKNLLTDLRQASWEADDEAELAQRLYDLTFAFAAERTTSEALQVLAAFAAGMVHED